MMSAPLLRILLVTDDSINGGTAHLARQLAAVLGSHFQLAFAGNLAKHPPAALRKLQTSGVELHDYAVHHDNPAQQAFGTLAAQELMNAARPDVVLFADANIVSLLALKEEAARLGVPFVVIVNSLPTTTPPQLKHHLSHARSTLRFASSVVFVCEAHRNRWQTFFPEAPPPQILIRNFCDDLFFEPRNDSARQRVRDELQVHAADFLCLITARLSPEKGQIVALRALKLLADKDRIGRTRFVFAGPANSYELDRFQTEVAKLKLEDRVSYLGSRDDVADLIDASDCFVLASSNEGASLSVAEAMAKGLPIITTDVGDMSKTVTPSCGAIIPSPIADADACIAALAAAIELFESDRERLRECGLQSKSRAQTLFKPDRAAAEYAAHLSEAHARRSPKAEDRLAPAPAITNVWHSLNFANPETAWNILVNGWSNSEPRGVWSVGATSRLVLHIQSSEPRIVLRFLVKPFLSSGWKKQTTEVQMHNRTISVWQATRSKSQTFDVEIDLAPNQTSVDLTFLNRTAASPYELGLNADERYLGFSFRKMFVLPGTRSLTDRLKYAALRAGLTKWPPARG